MQFQTLYDFSKKSNIFSKSANLSLKHLKNFLLWSKSAGCCKLCPNLNDIHIKYA